jgi:hypothetical protein
MPLVNRYLTDIEIECAAYAALRSYEMTGSAEASMIAAREHYADELGVKATASQIRYAYNRAMLKWESIKIRTRKAIEARQELESLEDRIARIVADVRGVIPKAMADRREALQRQIEALETE